jgi:putative Ca2+/H+ antiporter (TMEM165/GDT1 family)
MMLANVPVIYLGSKFAHRLPPKAIHLIASLIFVVLGGLALRNALITTPLFS